VLLLIAVAVAPLPGARATGAQRSAKLAPDVPMPQDVVDRMLTFVGVTSQDTVYDLGSTSSSRTA
jgi:hypothetical protein